MTRPSGLGPGIGVVEDGSGGLDVCVDASEQRKNSRNAGEPGLTVSARQTVQEIDQRRAMTGIPSMVWTPIPPRSGPSA